MSLAFRVATMPVFGEADVVDKHTPYLAGCERAPVVVGPSQGRAPLGSQTPMDPAWRVTR